jgi:predicted ATPase
VQQSEEALCVARATAHPFSEAFALLYAGGVKQFCRAVPLAQHHAAAALRVAEEQGFTFFAARAKSIEGWICAQQTRVDEGIAHMRQSLAVYERLGIERGLPHFLADLAEAYAEGGQYEEGEATLTRALRLVANTGERWYEAELWRLRGELTLQKGARNRELGAGFSSPQALSLKPQDSREMAQEAERYFLKAIAIARQQQAKSLELRAVMSLVRLRHFQASQHVTHTALTEAHNMLSEIYNWFTEGFDTKDLQEAQTLLTALSSIPGLKT